MAPPEKAAMPAHDATPDHSVSGSNSNSNTTLVLPNSWKYRRFTVAGYKLPWFASPPVQLIIVSIVCFMCPGMFNALNGMGGGGQLDPTANNRANTAVYSIYVASSLSYNHTRNLGFTTFAGALLGVCAGLLWCAQGAIMMSYPPEESKGRYISWFWMIFNLGAVIGSLVSRTMTSLDHSSLTSSRFLLARTSTLPPPPQSTTAPMSGS
jgi:MFS family permease